MQTDIQLCWLESVMNIVLSKDQVISLYGFFDIKFNPKISEFDYDQTDLVSALLVEANTQQLIDELDSIISAVYPFTLKYREAEKIYRERRADTQESLIPFFEAIKIPESKVTSRELLEQSCSYLDIWSRIFDELNSQGRWELEKKNVIAGENH